jgi:DNA-binding MarR family transcriptional regulator
MSRAAPLDLETMPGFLIRRAHQVSMALFAEECAAFDLTSVQFAALTAIGANPDIDATRLSAIIVFDRSTIGGVLDRLEAKGWVTRGGTANDRRIKLLRLTASGRDILRRVRPAVSRVQRRLLAHLAAEDRDRFMQLLLDMVKAENEQANRRQKDE